MPKQYRLDVHISTELIDSARKAAHARGFDSVAALVRTILEQDLRKASQQDQLESTGAASIDRMAKELRRLHNANQALFALTDSLVRLFLTCTPEPPLESLDATKRRAKLRYDRFLLSVAQNMTGDARATLLEVLKGDPDAR
jgi:hypothetical protein